MSKHYSVEYQSLPTGFGWTKNTDNLHEVEEIVESFAHKHLVLVTVYSYKHNDFIYYNDGFTVSVDLLHNLKRDLRTKSGLEVH